MRLHLPALCALSALLIGCSSGSDGTTSDPNPSDGQLDDQSALLDAGNFDSLLIGSLELLRAGYYDSATALLSEVALAWEEPQQAVVGTTVHDCVGGGTVNRIVTVAPVATLGPPVLELASELTFTDCVTSSHALNGVVGWDWNQSSPAQLGSTSFDSEYRFTDFSMARADASETLSGTLNERITIAGPGDSYTRTYSTQRYERVDADGTVLLTEGSYTQNFAHFIAQPGPGNGIAHLFSEQGSAIVSDPSLGMSNATVRIDPEIIYANEESASSTVHTSALESGAVELVMVDGSRLTVSVIAPGNDTVTYTLTDSSGQQTIIEREWIAPAICRADVRFNYDSC